MLVGENGLITRTRESKFKTELSGLKEELEELEKAKKMPITFDKDCPETTPERALKFRRVNPSRSTLRA